MIRATIAEVQKDLPGYLKHAQREPVEIEESGVVVARLVSGYDPDDEALMAWLSLPEMAHRFAVARQRIARGECLPLEDVQDALGIGDDPLDTVSER